MSDSDPSAATRHQLRQAYAEAWRKHVSGVPLTALEAMLADIIALHPEYHPTLRDLERAQSLDASPDGDRENPFLHLGLHMAVREQIAIDRPPGIRDLHRRLEAQSGDGHHAEHHLMEALGETLWEAQRSGRAPDETDYLQRARARLR